MNRHSLFRSDRIVWCLSWLCVSLLSGCGKVPTWDELTKNQNTTPPPATTQNNDTPKEVAPVQPVTPVVPVAPPRPSAEEVIANFKKLAPGQIENSNIAALCALDEGVELVTEINATGSKVTDEGLSSLYKLTNLRSLELVGTSVSNKGCEKISQVSSLESLSLTGGQISDEGIVHLKNLPQLKTLKINGTKLTPEGWEQVGHFPALEELWIQQSSLDDDAMAAICDANTLRILILNDTAITDKGLASLRKLDVLSTLNLSGCPVTGEGFAAAIKGNGLKTLHSITVQRTPLNDKGAAAIGSIKSLESLNIADLQGMSDKHLGMMVKAKKNLKLLNFSGNRGLTNNSLKALAELTELESLYIGEIPGINNQGLMFLKKLKNLKTISFNGTAITQAGIEKLREDIPGLNSNGARPVN